MQLQSVSRTRDKGSNNIEERAAENKLSSMERREISWHMFLRMENTILG